MAALAAPLGPAAAWAAGWARWQPHWPGTDMVLVGVLLAPVVEEIVFRGGLQTLLQQPRLLGRRRLGGISGANLGASLVFAALHVLLQGALMAAWVIVPALMLGWVYDRSARLVPVIGLHSLYNALWLGLLV